MSYVVEIRRKDNAPITYAELTDAVAGDPEFSKDTTFPEMETPSLVWCGGPGGKLTIFHHWPPNVGVESPSSEALRKMQMLATALNAEVVDESGEVLNLAGLPNEAELYRRNVRTGFIAMGGFAVVVVALLYWLLK